MISRKVAKKQPTRIRRREQIPLCRRKLLAVGVGWGWGDWRVARIFHIEPTRWRYQPKQLGSSWGQVGPSRGEGSCEEAANNWTRLVALSLGTMLSTVQQQRKRFKHELTGISHTTDTLILIQAFPFCSEFVSILIKQTKIFQRFKEKKRKWEGQWEAKVFSLFLHVNKRFCLTSNLPKLINVQNHQKLLT